MAYVVGTYGGVHGWLHQLELLPDLQGGAHPAHAGRGVDAAGLAPDPQPEDQDHHRALVVRDQLPDVALVFAYHTLHCAYDTLQLPACVSFKHKKAA